MAKKRPSDPIESWNALVTGMLNTKEAWKEHLEVMLNLRGFEELPLEAQHKLKFPFHKSPDFERFLEGFTRVYRGSGGLETMLIPIEEKEDVKRKESGVSRRKTE